MYARRSMTARLVPADTTDEAHRLQGEIYRRMSGRDRLAIAFELTDMVRRIAMAGIRARHPHYTDEQVFRAWARLTLGDEVLSAMWPDCVLVEP